MVGLQRHTWWIVLTALLQGLCGSSIALYADDLNTVRSESRAPPPPAAPPAPPRNDQPVSSSSSSNRPYHDERTHWDDDDDYSDPEFLSMLAIGGVIVAAAPIWVPVKLLSDDYDAQGYFTRYPYQRPVDGHLMLSPDVPRLPREWFARTWLDYGTQFDDISSLGGGLLVDTTTRFGIDATAQRYWQSRTSLPDDDLWIGSADLLFRFAQSTNVEMRTGVGFNWLSDQAGSDFGFNFTYGGDWYPLKPVVVSADLDFGKLGDATLFHARITAGLQWKRLETYVGYDFLNVGHAQLNTAVTGIRFWW